MNYGFPYMGNKSKIAPELISLLPGGERFIDLFGGGAAMSHVALLSGKYKAVVYSDYNPLPCKLLKQAIHGEFSYKRFKLKFISREDFQRLKGKSGYVRYIWSFGNRGEEYLFGRDKEPLKRAAHNFVVFGKGSEVLEDFLPEYKTIDCADIKQRRLKFKRLVLSKIQRLGTERSQQLEQLERLQQLQQLERLQQLQRLERLQQLERLERLEIHNHSYTDYTYQAGDVVYCDPPYEGTKEYAEPFDHKAFYDWVASRDYQVWFSNYDNVTDDRFVRVWEKKVKSSFSGSGNNCEKTECLYTNRKESGLTQLSLF